MKRSSESKKLAQDSICLRRRADICFGTSLDYFRFLFNFSSLRIWAYMIEIPRHKTSVPASLVFSWVLPPVLGLDAWVFSLHLRTYFLIISYVYLWFFTSRSLALSIYALIPFILCFSLFISITLSIEDVIHHFPKDIRF